MVLHDFSERIPIDFGRRWGIWPSFLSLHETVYSGSLHEGSGKGVIIYRGQTSDGGARVCGDLRKYKDASAQQQTLFGLCISSERLA